MFLLLLDASILTQKCIIIQKNYVFLIFLCSLLMKKLIFCDEIACAIPFGSAVLHSLQTNQRRTKLRIHFFTRMAVENSVTKIHGANIIVIAGDNETLQNLFSVIRKAENSSQLGSMTRNTVNSFENNPYYISSTKSCLFRLLIVLKKKQKYHINVVNFVWFVKSANKNVPDIISMSILVNRVNLSFAGTLL